MRFRWGMMLAVVVALAVVVEAGLAPAAARAADCSLADQSYNGACGPQFETPAWGDGAGWTDPSKYSTIQLADLTGNGVDELIARNDDGLEIWKFDTTVGQWRPALDANGHPQVLTDFHSPLPSESGWNWNQPQYYKTIQTVDLNGDGAREIIARFPDGMHVYQYTPPAGTKSIDGGTWSLVSEERSFGDAHGWTDPSRYLTIHAAAAIYGHGNGGWISQFRSEDKFSSRVVFTRPNGITDNLTPLLIPYDPDPARYLNLQVANLPTAPRSTTPMIVGRNGGGVFAAYFDKTGWHRLAYRLPLPGGPFADNLGPDCGPQQHGCFGDSPSYYETMQFANVDGKPGQELLGRLSDGLHVYKLEPNADASKPATWKPLATLTALAGAGDDPALKPGMWSSIQATNLDGKAGDEILALDGNGLQAWSHDAAADKWTKLNSSTPLKLSGDMWDKNASYYSTIHTGDVTGDGHQAVIARGPFGIRTWFYNLKPGSGWTSWMPQDTSSYPQFTGGQAAAFAALNTQAKSVGAIPSDAASVRDAWTGENAPTTSKLATLRQAILGFAGCSGATNGNPPYTTCAPPPGSSGFTATDWTAVVNQVLTEIGRAQAVDDFFGELDRVRQKLFISQGAELDAIAAKLGLSGAAGNETTVKPGEISGGVLKIIGAIAGAIPGVGHVVAAPFEVAGELAGLLASDSPTLNSEFTVKYADLKEKFATMITEIDKGLEVQSQEVRSSYGLLSLVSELTTGQGPWANPDLVGLESADAQGFALWSYQQLLPTVFVRYAVTACNGVHDFNSCGLLSDPGPETIGAQPDFTTIGPPPTPDGGLGGDPPRPCRTTLFVYHACTFRQVHDVDSALATRIWGPLSNTCNYQPGNSATKWTFGCNLGVSADSSVSLTDGPANGWNFHNYCGSPDTSHGTCTGATGSAAVGTNSHVSLTGAITLPKSFRVKTATIAPDRLLYEPAGPDGGSVVVVDQSASGRELGAVRMARHGDPGDFADPPGGMEASLELGKTTGGQRSYDLKLTGVNVTVPDACQALPASDALSTPPFKLTSTLRLSDGRHTHVVSLPAVWRCVRDRAGQISELRPTSPRRPVQRPGLAVTLAGPRVLGPAASVIYQVRVQNRRRGPRQPLISSLWRVLVQASVAADSRAAEARARPRTVGRVTMLGGDRSRTLRLPVHVPSSAAGRICIGVAVTADSARPAVARICPQIARTIARPPPVGLG